jgi:hypothetical protein
MKYFTSVAPAQDYVALYLHHKYDFMAWCSTKQRKTSLLPLQSKIISHAILATFSDAENSETSVHHFPLRLTFSMITHNKRQI